MDNRVKSVSLFGNICEKFETFYSEIDGIIKQDLQYAEYQLLTAGGNVKQFCSEFMEEMLPEYIINSLQETPSENEKSVVHSCGVLDKEANAGLSDCIVSTPSISMETIEEADITLSFTLKGNDGREMSFEENRFKETKFLPEIFKYEGPDSLPNLLQVDSQSSYSPEARETNDFDPQVGKARLSTAKHLTNSIVSAGSNECQILENEESSSGRTLSKELVDEGLNGHKAGKTRDKYDTELGVVQLPNKVKIENSIVVVDTKEHCSTFDCLEPPPIYQGSACKSCSTMKSEKECECEKLAGTKDLDAESVNPEGKFLSQPLPTGESESVNEEFCGSDWVII